MTNDRDEHISLSENEKLTSYDAVNDADQTLDK